MAHSHFDGITPEQRWRNDLLNEQRKTNELLERLIGRNAQASETKPAVSKPSGRRVDK